MRVRYLAENKVGQDWVVGDIHGCFDLLDAALHAARFNPELDRLLCVGDLVDRGSQSHQVLAFLARPYVYAILGNHEEFYLASYDYDVANIAKGVPAHFVTERMGNHWWVALPNDLKARIFAAFLQLPLALEVATPQGMMGLVHAEVPIGMSWLEFKYKLGSGEPSVALIGLRGRTRARTENCTIIEEVSRVYCGHTVQATIRIRGNTVFMDTGGVFCDEQGRNGHLSLVALTASEADILRAAQTQVAWYRVISDCAELAFCV
jgi:serine/threonine protein phosphatase 1